MFRGAPSLARSVRLVAFLIDSEYWCTAVMSKWWRKVQESLPKPSSLKKTASKNVSFVQRTYDEGMSKRARSMPVFRAMSAELRKQARERAEEAASRLAARTKALRSKAAEAAKDAAKNAAAVGLTATKTAASAGARSAREAGRRATGRVFDAVPKIGSYASWTARRIAYLLLGTAFVYGVGSSLPGAVARYFVEKDRRRRDEEQARRREGGGSEPSSLPTTAVAEEGGVGARVVERSWKWLPEAVEAYLRKR